MTNVTKLSRTLTVAAVLSLTTANLFAQNDAANLIKGGTEDANKLMGAYAGPLMKSIGCGLNGGWFQTAKPHGLGGFDITFSINAPFAPTSDQSYDVNGFKNIKPDPSNTTTTAPTIFGDAKEGPKMNVYAPNPLYTNFAQNFPGAPNPYQKDTAITSFNLPQGLGVNVFPMPTAQLAVGVGFGTEVAVRFIPSVPLGDAAKIGLVGFAVKHDFKQWIPGMKELPFDLSAMFGYTSLSLENKFTGESAVAPETGPDIQPDQSGKTYDNQKLSLTSKAWTTNIIISKKLGPFTPYVGVGYQKAATDLKLEGDFPITMVNENYNPAAVPGSPNSYVKKIDAVSDPISISGNVGGFRANVGFRLKLAILTIHGDYTFAQYNVASVGLGLNLQSIAPFKL